MALFNRNKTRDSEEDRAPMESEDELELPVKPGSRPALGGAVPPRTAAVAPVKPPEAKPIETRPASEMARRLVEPPSMPGAAAAKRDSEMRKLIVGREISLAGEITSCDRLIVEGSVQANLASCREVEITETGVYKGSADIDECEIRGLFEGTLHVRGRLLIRSTGRVTGTVQYGQIEIEIGGQISGEIQAQPSTRPSQPGLTGSFTE